MSETVELYPADFLHMAYLRWGKTRPPYATKTLIEMLCSPTFSIPTGVSLSPDSVERLRQAIGETWKSEYDYPANLREWKQKYARRGLRIEYDGMPNHTAIIINITPTERN